MIIGMPENAPSFDVYLDRSNWMAISATRRI